MHCNLEQSTLLTLVACKIIIVETQTHMHFQSTHHCKESNAKVFFTGHSNLRE